MVMERNDRKGYFAFISYKREDAKWADWLQHELEHYRLPSNLNGREDLPKSIRPVFKDTSELNPTCLPRQIQEALADSRFLIVICSPRSAKSEWVNKEVETFVGMGKTDCIIPFIIEGKTHSEDPATECYPKALRELPANQEILGANINEYGKKAALVKVIAQMLGLKFDTLWQRTEKEKKKKHIIRYALLGFLLLLSMIIGTLLFIQNWRIKENHTRYMIKEMNSLIENGESYTAARLALALLPDNILFPNRPYLPEVEAVLREALNRDETSISLADGHHLALLSPDGALIAVEGFNCTYIFRSKDGKLLHQLVEHVDGVNGSTYDDYNGDWLEIKEFSPDGIYMATSYHPYMDSISTSIWNIQTGKKENDIVDLVDTVYIIQRGDDNVYHSYNLKKNKVISSSYVDSDIRLSSLISGSFIADFKNNTKYTRQVGYTPSGQHVIGRHGNQFAVWNSRNGKLMKQISNALDIYWGAPRHLYLTTRNGKIVVCDAMDGHSLFTLAIKIPLSDISSVYFSKSGKRIVVEAWMGNVSVYDSDTGKEILSLEVATEGDFWGVISEDDKVYISCGVGASTEFYDLETGKRIENMQLGYCNSLSISKDRKWMATVNEGRTDITIYEFSTRKSRTYAVPKANSIVFSPDSKLLLSCHGDSALRIWDVESGVLMSTLRGHQGSVVSASFSPNGKEIISSSLNGEIKRWLYLPSQELIDKARERFKDVPLTKEEKKKFFF